MELLRDTPESPVLTVVCACVLPTLGESVHSSSRRLARGRLQVHRNPKVTLDRRQMLRLPPGITGRMRGLTMKFLPGSIAMR